MFVSVATPSFSSMCPFRPEITREESSSSSPLFFSFSSIFLPWARSLRPSTFFCVSAFDHPLLGKWPAAGQQDQADRRQYQNRNGYGAKQAPSAKVKSPASTRGGWCSG